MHDDAVDRWLQRPGMASSPPDRLDARAWARARIERLLDPRALPGGAWVFLPSLLELHAHATPAERVALLRRASVPRHDDTMRWLAPFDGALLEAIEASPPTLRGVQLDDTYAVLLALGAVVARHRTSLPFDARWEPFVARDLSLYDRFDFAFSRAALAALPEARRRALVTASVARGEAMAAQVLDAIPFDEALFERAFELVVRAEPGSEHGASATQGLARVGRLAVPALRARLTRPKAPAAELCVALNALGWIRDPESAESLVAATGHGSAAVRLVASRALAALGASAHDAVIEGTRARKTAVREACAWLRSLLDGDDATPLRAVRDAHAALDDDARRRIATAREGEPGALRDVVNALGAGAVVEVTDRWCEGDPQSRVPYLLACQKTPGVAWAMAWVVATRPMHRRHHAVVLDALKRCDDRADAAAWLKRAPWPHLVAAGESAG